jgi:hypothetical protein
MLLCQVAAMIAFLIFLGVMQSRKPPPPEPDAERTSRGATAVFVGATRGDPPEERKRDKPPEETEVEEASRQPRRPEQFRPESRQNARPSRGPDLPEETRGRPAERATVTVPPRDLPLSYLMKFRGMEDFHSFLDDLPPQSGDGRTMSLIRIEGLPRTEVRMRKLFESYRMRPFLFNPDRFNYLITSDLRLLRDKRAIQDYIVRMGRYLRQNGENRAYERVKAEFVNRARSEKAIRQTLAGAGEFTRMQLGLASPHLTAFLRRLEEDTLRQVSELTGRALSIKDIARIDCRFREVNGALVLVPWQAYLGSSEGVEPVRIWREG